MFIYLLFPPLFFNIHHPQIQLWMMANSNGLGDQLLPPSSSDRVGSLVQLCLDMSDEGFLLLCIFVRPSISFNPFASFRDERGNSTVTWSIDVVDYDDVQDLVFSDEKDLSCRMTKVLDRVAHKSPSSCCTLGRLLKYNIPRFLRLTDVSSIDHNSSYS
jgi:hypothetical protein